MNCLQAHQQLPALIYGDLTPEEKTALEKHLEGCLPCRQACAALRGIRELLDRVPAPESRLDVSQVYRQAAERQTRRVRFWRRAATALCGTAAALLVVALLSRMEVRLEPDQIVLRLGSPRAGGEAIQSPLASVAQPARVAFPDNHSLAATEEQLQLLSQLIHALADSTEVRDLRQRQELVQLRVELRDLQRRTAQWRMATEHDVDALYTAQLISTKKGEKP